MNPTTQQTNSQPQNNGQPNPATSAAQSAANLGFVTNMHEQLLKYKADQSGKQTLHNAPQAPKTNEETHNDSMVEDKKLGDLEGKMEQKMEIMRTEIKDTVKTEIDSLREDIKNALENEQE